MTCLLDNCRICLSNNAAERALRGMTFAGSDRGGDGHNSPKEHKFEVYAQGQKRGG
jgi:hypothetical protein